MKTILAQRPFEQNIPQRFFSGLLSLLKGMRVTLHYLIRPSTVVTAQYPENRESLKLADRVRAQMKFRIDENGWHKCTACRICEQQCPNGSILVTERKPSATGRPELDTFMWRMDSCTFCNICVMVCPFQVLEMTANFESSVYDQKLLIYNLAPYAGPTVSALLKITDEKERARMIEPRGSFSGPTALAGHSLPGVAKTEFFATMPRPNSGVTEDRK